MTIIRLSNTSNVNFRGSLRANIDWTPPFEHGYFPGVMRYDMGRQSGLDTRQIHVNVGLQAGEYREYDLAESVQGDWDPLGEWDANAKQHFGGVPVTVAGTPLQHIRTRTNGAALDGHWRGKVGGLVVNLWVWWYPENPEWCEGRIAIVASSPGTPSVRTEIPREFELEFGNAIVWVPGLSQLDTLMERDDWLADGQPRILPLTLCFDDASIDVARVVADQKVTIRGIKKLHQDGNPYTPPNFDGRDWAAKMLPVVAARQHDWFSSPMDPAEESRRTGAQGSQALAAAAISHPATVGVYTIAGLDVSYPMIHLEPSGEPLDWKNHPGLRMVYGRVNRRDNISSDDLGKPFDPDAGDSHGQTGPDTEEHWFDFTAWAAARLTGCPAMQWILHSHAVLFLHRFVTVPPGAWLTASRGIGWALLVAVECYRNLEDRELANALKQRVHELMPLIQAKCANGGYWDWTEAPSIGGSPGHRRAMPWQMSVLAMGLDWAGFVFGIGAAWDLGIEIAVQVYERAWVKRGNRWHSRDVIAEDGSDTGLNPATGQPYEDAYLWFGSPFAIATILRHNRTHPNANEIWNQYLADQPSYEQGCWLPPIGNTEVGP